MSLEQNVAALRDYIQKVASKLYSEQQFKNTITGTIKSSELGYYKVQLTNGASSSLIYAKSLDNSTYSIDDYVYLLTADVASGDTHQTNYFIFGLVSVVEHNYQNLSDWERFVGRNEATAYLEVLTDAELEFSNLDFIDSLKEFGNFAVSARFTANAQEYFGIKIKVIYLDNEETEFDFDTAYFTGQPQSFVNIEQHKVFSLERRDVKKVVVTSLNQLADVSKVSLQVGTLTNVIKDVSVELENVSKKGFFNKNDQSQLIEIKSKVKYGNQILNTNELKYYWFVENDAITISSKAGYNILGGEGWECLNTYHLAKAIESGHLVEREDIKIYDTANNFYDFSSDLMTKYENKIKCIAVYQLSVFESEPITLYDFNHEEYDVSVEVIEGELPLLYSDETVVIGAKMLSKVVLPDNTAVRYEWYLDGDNESLKYYHGIEYDNYSQSSLKVGFSNKENTQNIYYLPVSTQSASFYCKVFVDDTEVAESNRVAVYSKISTEKDLQEVYNYQYFVSDKNNIRFKARESEEMEIKLELSNGAFTDKDRFVYYVLESGGNLIAAQSLEWLKTDAPFNNSADDRYYLYYTSQKIVIDANKNDAILRYDDYFEPKILRCCDVQNQTVVSELPEAGVEQLNNFNTLTNKGLSDGIYFQDAKYSLSTIFDSKKLATGHGYYKKEDTYGYKKVDITRFEPGVEYYIKNGDVYTLADSFVEGIEYYNYILVRTDYTLLEQNSDNYVIANGSPSAFIDGKEYYEQEGGDLYINATYIRSGHLEVSDGDKEIFSADIDTKEVRIGGFHVTENHLASGVCADGSGDHLVIVSPGVSEDGKNSGNFAFWAGEKNNVGNRPFWIKNDGSFYATKGEIGGCKIIDGTLSITTTNFDDESKSKLVSFVKIYYALSEKKTEFTGEESDWNPVAPEEETGKYMWQRTVTTYVNGKEETTETCIAGAKGEDGTSPYLVVISSTNGDKFKNGEIETTLSATVYYGDSDVTHSIEPGRFIWTRTSTDLVGDANWNENMSNNRSKTVKITKEDVQRKATFFCTILK